VHVQVAPRDLGARHGEPPSRLARLQLGDVPRAKLCQC
jgi:hypothetical protein